MPDRVNIADVTCAASVPSTAPTEIYLVQFAPGIPRKVTIVIPAGHSGMTGIALGYGHNPVIPDNAGAFISGDDDVVHLELTSYPAGPTWSAFLCNNDLQPHSWQVRFEFDEITQSLITPTPEALSPDDILAAAPADDTGV